MAGYSGTALSKKLGLRDQTRLLILGAPWDYLETVGLADNGRKIATRVGADELFVHLFLNRVADLTRLPRLALALADEGILWLSWPKKSSGVATDLTEEIVRQAGLSSGLVDVKVCAVDEIWSGLKFVRRIKDRGGKGREP